MKRREFLTLPVSALGGTLLYTLAKEPIRLQAQEGNVKIPLRFFSAGRGGDYGGLRAYFSERCDRSWRDGSRGGHLHDRQLAGPYGRDKYRYTKGPFVESVPEHGYQAKENPREMYRAGDRVPGTFVDLPPDQQDANLRSIEKTVFFQMLRSHTLEGMFCDPMHGGNAGLIGWQLIGFPGPRMSYRDEVDKYHGLPYRPKPVSLEQVVGHPVHGWEEEKD